MHKNPPIVAYRSAYRNTFSWGSFCVCFETPWPGQTELGRQRTALGQYVRLYVNGSEQTLSRFFPVPFKREKTVRAFIKSAGEKRRGRISGKNLGTLSGSQKKRPSSSISLSLSSFFSVPVCCIIGSSTFRYQNILFHLATLFRQMSAVFFFLLSRA